MSMSFMQIEGSEIDFSEVFRRLEEKKYEECSLQQYFPADEWATMCDYEKMRYRNMKINYDLMVEFGVPIGKPEFMQRKRKKPAPPPIPDSSDSDDEWTPAKEREKERQAEMIRYSRRKRKSTERWQPPPIKITTVDTDKATEEGRIRALARIKQQKDMMASSSSVSKPDTVDLFADEEIEEFYGFTKADIKAAEKHYKLVKRRNETKLRRLGINTGTAKRIPETATSLEVRTSRYPRRNIPQTDYSTIEVPDDDCFLYCEDCDREHLGDCPVHGPLIVVEDTVTAPDDQLRADHSCPDGLTIQESIIPYAGSGAWTSKLVPRGVRFGPYQGDIVYDLDEVHASGYGWQIFKNDKASHYVDARNIATSNWMRYVNCARHEDEQNLIAFQYCGNIYYRTLQPVESGRELLVWYGEEYAKEMGIMKLPGQQQVQQMKHQEQQTVAHTQQSNQQKPQKPTVWQLYRNPDVVGFHCELCGKMFSVEGYLSMHKWRVHGQSFETGFTCDVCGQKLPTAARLQEHSKLHGKQEICSKCGVLIANNRTIHVCQKESTSAVDANTVYMRNSMRICSDEKPYTCSICGKGFAHQHVLTTHMRIHSGEKPFTCSVCGKSFTYECNLTTHMRIHSGEGPFSCSVCGKSFTYECNLTTHMRIHSGEKPFTCSVCGIGCTQKGDLTKHMRIHSGEKPFTCSVCGKGCTQQPNLTKHMRIHSGEKPFTCSVCGRCFNRQFILTTHMRIHSGEKPFTCSVCGKCFNLQHNLTRHMRIHSGEKPFTCSVCGKGFNQQIILTRHMRIHSGEKPFTCSVCGKCFSQSSSLRSHNKIHNSHNTNTNS